MQFVRSSLSVVWLTSVLLLSSSAVYANLIKNGSFEEGPAPGSFITLGAGSRSLPGWSIESGSIDYVGTLWEAAEGQRSVDLSGEGPGTISQTFATQSGTVYAVRFAMSGNPGASPFTVGTVVTVGPAEGSAGTQRFNFDTHGHVFPGMGYEVHTFFFRATESVTTLTFTSFETVYGPVIDDVSVIPEPAFSNGSFEEGQDPGSFITLPFPGSFIRSPVGTPVLPGWVLESGSIDYVGTLWEAAEGQRSVDLNGDINGDISQTFWASRGGYTVRFAMAGNPGGGPTTKTLDVILNGVSQQFSFNTAGRSFQNMGYEVHTLRGGSSGELITLTFRSLNRTPFPQAYGPVIDDVRVIPDAPIVNVNDFVNFVAEPQSFETTSDTSGCASGFVGKFSFTATLAAKQGSPPLSLLTVRVAELSNGNLMQKAGGVDGLWRIPTELDSEYRDGILRYPENVGNIPFTICLTNSARFTFFVDVLGAIEQ
jgi:choice-of-anchor C domain-containing protein